MIKLKQVQTQQAEVLLTFEYDQGGIIQTIVMNKQDIVDRLKTVKQKLGRALTVQDARLVIVKIVNELREGKTPLTEDFDYIQFIGVDLEA
jgi:hypothetical protein